MESKDYKMSWNNIGFQANYSSLYRNDKSLHHKISFFVENLSGKYGLKETSIGLNADGNKKFTFYFAPPRVLEGLLTHVMPICLFPST